MPAVSNSSPLIALAEIGQLDLLPRLFGSIWIPPAVAAEIAPSLPTLPAWIDIRQLTEPMPSTVVRRALGAGEREALALTLQSRPRCAILDDLAARRIATVLGLPIIGTLGLLLAAKEARLIDSVRPHLDRLADQRFFISENLYRELLNAAGEPTT